MELTEKLVKMLGEKLHIDFNKIPLEEFWKGIQIEEEHNHTINSDFPKERELRDWIMYARIARDHLFERTDYYTQLVRMEEKPIEPSDIEMLKKAIREIIKEIHYPPKAIDLNKVKNPDDFWNMSVQKAANLAGLNSISNAKRIADIILWLNMVATHWDDTQKRMVELTLRKLIEEEIQSLTERKFVLKGQQINSFEKLLNAFGANVSDVAEEMQEEAVPAFKRRMSSSEMEASGLVIKVDENVLSKIQEFVELGKDAKGWYNELNQKIMSALGESDGTLWLMLFAITSPRNTLATNFRLASQIYIGIKKDLADPKKKEMLEKMLDEKDLYTILRGKEKEPVKHFVRGIFGIKQYQTLGTVRGMMTGSKNINATIPNLVRILKLYKSKGYRFTKKDVVDEMSKHLTEKGTLGKNSLISAEKVFSFTLNLISPSYAFEDGWMPVTIDTWMVSFFYPHMSNAEKVKILGKSPNYVYMAKKTQELAPQFGMKPQELQAVLWVAMIKKTKGEKYASTLNQAIEKNLVRLNVAKDEMQKMSGMFNKIIQVIGSGA